MGWITRPPHLVASRSMLATKNAGNVLAEMRDNNSPKFYHKTRPLLRGSVLVQHLKELVARTSPTTLQAPKYIPSPSQGVRVDLALSLMCAAHSHKLSFPVPAGI